MRDVFGFSEEVRESECEKKRELIWREDQIVMVVMVVILI